ncbi:MAG: ankyrin repeat domain-containing protein [Rhodoferax sp.]|nr:ankyrin repeat domain-containing protein [Rhodoferax sp.]
MSSIYVRGAFETMLMTLLAGLMLFLSGCAEDPRGRLNDIDTNNFGYLQLLREGRYEDAAIFIDYYVNPPRTGVYKDEILPATAAHGRVELVSKLVALGANVNFYLSPLHSAVYSGDVATVKYLLDHGANIEMDSHGETPLLYANRLGRDAVKQFLISKGANLNAKDMYGYSISEAQKSSEVRAKQAKISEQEWIARQKIYEQEEAVKNAEIAKKNQAIQAEWERLRNAPSTGEACDLACMNARGSADALKKMQDADNARRNRDSKADCVRSQGANAGFACR